MQIQTHTGTDLASRCSPEGCGVNVLGAKPFAVPKLDTGEELQGREHIWHALQPQQCRLDLVWPELAVCSVGGRQSKACNPARVIIYKEVDQLIRKVKQHRQLGEQGGHGQLATRSPSKVLHCQGQVSPVCHLHACPSLYERQGNCASRLCPPPDAAPKTVCHA
jgi:hypothetical protein